jgi:transposase-like protein
VSVTSATIFDKTRTPLSTWLAAGWYMTNQKTAGVSAKGLQRVLDLGSYQTAWTMLHKYRSAMVRPGRDLLTGDVEVDETLVGGTRPGRPGRGALGKSLVVVAVEVLSPTGFGRARLQPVDDASKATLTRFVTDTIEPGSVVLTDGWRGYLGVTGAGYTHKPTNISASGLHAHVTMPAVHRVASLFKRSLLNAYQQYPKLHLQAYCDEWVFRFNRRRSRNRGLLFLRLMELAVNAPPLPYTDLVVSSRPRTTPPTPPGTGGSPRRAAVNTTARPWRRAEGPSRT